MQDDLPVVFVGTVQRLTAHLRQNAFDPLRVIVTFGEGAMEELPRDLLRRLFSISTLWDVPVEFPEQPGVHSGLVEVEVLSEHHLMRTWLTPEELIVSR